MTDSEDRTILLIGSGPIKIGQAAEFDYSGAQACRALLLESAAGLRAGVVKLGRLSDLNRAAPDQEYRPVFGVRHYSGGARTS